MTPISADLFESSACRWDVDVVILTHNDAEFLKRAVGSVISDRYVRPRLWVIDNASTVPVSIALDAVTVVRNDKNRGVGGGRNQGIQMGSAPVICILDSDAEVVGNALGSLVSQLSDPSIGIAVPVFEGQEPTASAGVAPTLRVKLQRAFNLRSTYEPAQGTNSGATWDVDFGIGACQVFRRECYDAVGGLDESDPFGPEDLDFCLRVRDAGWRVVQVASAKVKHPPRRGHRSIFTLRGMRHGFAILRHYAKRTRLMRSVSVNRTDVRSD